MKRLFIASLCFILTGCMPAAYSNFSMVKPTSSPNMSYSDQHIDISFYIRRSGLCGIDGMQQYWNYDGLGFTLINKTDDIITIDWNKISFTDYRGSSGHTVMHANIKYTDCASPKVPTIIPPRGRISDVIIPCYAVTFHSGMYGSQWIVSILPSPRRYPTAKFGVFMPIQIGKRVINYEFDFRAES